jgi:hypothetical protein
MKFLTPILISSAVFGCRLLALRFSVSQHANARGHSVGRCSPVLSVLCCAVLCVVVMSE